MGPDPGEGRDGSGGAEERLSLLTFGRIGSLGLASLRPGSIVAAPLVGVASWCA
jgi:hypothetical protein